MKVLQCRWTLVACDGGYWLLVLVEVGWWKLSE